MRKEWPVKWHSNPGQRRRFALKPRTKLTATWAGHSEATAARSASPKTPAISARNTGLPSCGVARYGVYGQRLRYRWYSPDRKRRRSAVGHRRLVFSIGSPPPAPRRAPTRCRRLPPMVATFAFKSDDLNAVTVRLKTGKCLKIKEWLSGLQMPGDS